MNEIKIEMTLEDAREVLRLLKSCNLDGLRGATLEAARALLDSKIGEALQAGPVITIHKA